MIRTAALARSHFGELVTPDTKQSGRTQCLPCPNRGPKADWGTYDSTVMDLGGDDFGVSLTTHWTRVPRGFYIDSEATGLARLPATGRSPTPPAELSLPPAGDTDAFAKALCFLPAPAREIAVSWLRKCSPLSRRMHRNTRQTLRRYYEMGLLERAPPKRDVKEDPFDFETDEERQVYEAVTRYIDRRFQELEVQKPGKGFVMTIYRRRAASSPFALRKSLDRRATGLKAVVAQRAYDDTVLELDDAEELEDLLNVKLTSALPDTLWCLNCLTHRLPVSTKS